MSYEKMVRAAEAKIREERRQRRQRDKKLVPHATLAGTEMIPRSELRRIMCDYDGSLRRREHQRKAAERKREALESPKPPKPNPSKRASSPRIDGFFGASAVKSSHPRQEVEEFRIDWRFATPSRSGCSGRPWKRGSA